MSENETPSAQMPPGSASPSGDERMWVLLGHLSAFSAFITGIGCVIGPLLVWLVKRDELPFAADQAREALNFNITFALACLALWVLTVGTFFIGIVVTLPLFFVLLAAWFVMTIVAAVKANEGVAYRYPIVWRIVK
jgi:uncharacterized Tic20 family protein